MTERDTSQILRYMGMEGNVLTTGVQISHPIRFPSQTTLANVCLVYQTTVTEDTVSPFYILHKIVMIILVDSQCGDHNVSAEPFLVNVIVPFVMRSTDNAKAQQDYGSQ